MKKQSKFRLRKGNEIIGNLDIKIVKHEEVPDGELETSSEVLIHGDPEGLKSLAEQLLYLAHLNQEEVPDQFLPKGAREHITLRVNRELSASSVQTTIGRLDSKGYQEFYPSYQPKS